MGGLVSLVSAPRFRNKTGIEIISALLSLTVVTIVLAGFGALPAGVMSSGGALLLAIYLVLGLIIAERILLVLRRRPFASSPLGFRPPTVPLKRFVLRGNLVAFDEVARVLLRQEPDGKRVAYAILRDGSMIMLREVEGVPSEFMDNLARTVGRTD